MSNEISSTMRDYLAEIYRLSERSGDQNGYVSTSTLADLLLVSPPAVNRMVTKLRDLGLLQHEPYQGISLTEEGKREALQRLRTHRITEAFLVKVMDFGWHEVYDEAHRMSSSLSKPLADRMLEMAGYPTRCPHGEPIPTEDRTIENLGDILLANAEAGRTYHITRILTREPERLEYIDALGLVPEAKLEVIHMAPFSGPMQLKLGEEYRIIGHNLAELIRVRAES